MNILIKVRDTRVRGAINRMVCGIKTHKYTLLVCSGKALIDFFANRIRKAWYDHLTIVRTNFGMRRARNQNRLVKL